MVVRCGKKTASEPAGSGTDAPVASLFDPENVWQSNSILKLRINLIFFFL